MRCIHVDEAGHDDGVPVVKERPAEHEAPVVPDGDGVDEPSFDLHCRHQPTTQQASASEKLTVTSQNSEPQGLAVGFHVHPQSHSGSVDVPAAGPTRPSVTTRSLATQKWSCGRRLHPSPPKLCSNRRAHGFS
jgi:hypothetical protein